MNHRKVKQAIYAPVQDMGEIQVRQPFPSPALQYPDPFILLHHAHIFYEEGTDLNKAGVSPHPHRGFSPLTFVFKGGSHHRDSRGNDKKIREGGTQWMHAGMGIMHSERPLENEMEIIQLWINSPSANKMDQPSYHPIDKAETPEYNSEDALVNMLIVSGELMDIKGPIPTLSPVNSGMLFMKAGSEIEIKLPETHNACLYILDGSISIDEAFYSGKHLIEFENSGEGIFIKCQGDLRAIILSGEPINEKIVAHGPFVMSNETQNLEAFRDYRMGKLGILIEDN